jgi:pimeloyl-ACP methyl ester carboxylesterase
VLIATAAVATAFGLLISLVPPNAANAVLHPVRNHVVRQPDRSFEEVTFAGDGGVKLRGWRFRATAPVRGTIVSLHGIADNRSGAIGIAQRFTPLGFDVIAYDSRAHGESEGDMCTYGSLEKRDLSRVLDALNAQRVILLGTSLGAAIALQAAADDARVKAVVAAEVFSDLRTVVRDRAPLLVPGFVIGRALARVEERGGFDVNSVSPVVAAARVTVPVLLIHGALDRDTRPDHSRRVLAALRGPKRLILVEGARHNESLRGADIWREIEQWVTTLSDP